VGNLAQAFGTTRGEKQTDKKRGQKIGFIQLFITHFMKKLQGITLLALSFLLLQCKKEEKEQVGKVVVKKDATGYHLWKDNKPFYINGAAGFEHFKELKEAGGNVMRTWDTTHLQSILDSAQANGLFVMVGFPMLESRYMAQFYDHDSHTQKQYEDFKKVVQRYRHHPSLLIWCLGNELDFPFRPSYANFYRTFNRLVKMIKEEDPDHPITTTLVNYERRPILNILTKVKGLDFISINTFGKLTHLEKDLKAFEWVWNGPFLITEWGANGTWEADSTAWGEPIEKSNTEKASIYAERYRYIERMKKNEQNRALGALVFYWGQKQEKTPTWFSLFSEDGKRSQAVNVLSEIWKGKKEWKDAPPVLSLKIDGKTAQENILLTANTWHTARIYLDTKDTQALHFKWEIRPSDAHSYYFKNKQKLQTVEGLFRSAHNAQAEFTSPSQEGAYRVYAQVSDAHGNFTSVNTPFYVLKDE
jgi:beta-galactosidase/beta-glucuronidase